MTPKVTIILTHHLDENRAYLNQAMESIKESRGVDAEVILLASSETCPDAPHDFLVIHDRSLDTATKKVHKAVRIANPGSKHFLFMSDDVVLSRHALAELVKASGDALVIMNPLSNSDNGGQFHAGWLWKPDLNLGDVDIEEQVYDFRALPPILVDRPFVSFYCTLIPRLVWERVGELDERLETRHNDQDYCMRAKRLGIQSLINFGAFALHYGSKTLSKTCKSGEQDLATQHFIRKWSVPTEDETEQSYRTGGD